MTYLQVNRPIIKLIYGVGFLFALYITALNVISFFTNEMPFLFSFDSGRLVVLAFFVSAALITIIILCVFLLRRYAAALSRLPNAAVAGVIFVLSLSARLVFAWICKTEQFSDYELLLLVTTEIAGETPEYLGDAYFKLWAYQTGFPAIMSPIYRLFGSIEALIAMNCAFMSLCSVFLYLLVSSKHSRSAAIFVSLLFFLFPYPYSLAPVYTNQHLAAALTYAAIFLLFSKETPGYLRCILAALCLAFANAARPEGILIIAAVAVLSLISLYAHLRTEGIRAAALGFASHIPAAAFIAGYFIFFALISGFVQLTGLNPAGLSNNFPLYKFAVGFNHETAGAYSNEDVRYLISEVPADDREQRDERAKGLISERLSAGPGKLTALFHSKTARMWTAGQADYYAAFHGKGIDERTEIFGLSVEYDTIEAIFSLWDSIFTAGIFALCTLVFLKAFLSRESEPLVLFLALFLLAAIGVFMLIEVQRRYSYIVMPALFAISAENDLFTKKRAK